MSADTRSGGRVRELARELNERRPTITPADLLLLTIPALLVSGVLTAWLSALSLAGALFIACLPALLATGYALFYDPPETPDGADREK
ncbi:hypothetical protein BRC86_13685 [Halobacteriales archaeon QS_3_64_16]|nr:MAG: hypothetical protein BRC86_13685 [Halobacteriales archaeon QS_3_64_16]